MRRAHGQPALWDNPARLGRTTRWLYGIAGVLAAYGLLRVLAASSYFNLREIELPGELKHVTREQAELIVRSRLRGNFFTLDMRETKTVFEKLPWVRRADISRRWPGTIVVKLEEQQALARWQTGALVNAHGELFQAASDAEMPYFFGPPGSSGEVTRNYREFSRAFAPLGLSIAAIEVSARGAWRLKLDNGMELALGREDMQARLARFASAWPVTVALIEPQPRKVDLRYRNGFAVRAPGKG